MTEKAAFQAFIKYPGRRPDSELEAEGIFRHASYKGMAATRQDRVNEILTIKK
jgi:hypothetical protein